MKVLVEDRDDADTATPQLLIIIVVAVHPDASWWIGPGPLSSTRPVVRSSQEEAAQKYRLQPRCNVRPCTKV